MKIKKHFKLMGAQGSANPSSGLKMSTGTFTHSSQRTKADKTNIFKPSIHFVVSTGTDFQIAKNKMAL